MPSISLSAAGYERLEAVARRRRRPLGGLVDDAIRKLLGLPRRGVRGDGRWFWRGRWRGRWRDPSPRAPAPERSER